MLLPEDPIKFRFLLDSLDGCVRMSGIRFSPSKYRLFFDDWIGSKLNLILAAIKLVEVYRFRCLVNGTLSSGCLLDIVFSDIQKTRLAFTSFSHLWRRPDIRLSISGEVHP